MLAKTEQVAESAKVNPQAPLSPTGFTIIGLLLRTRSNACPYTPFTDYCSRAFHRLRDARILLPRSNGYHLSCHKTMKLTFFYLNPKKEGSVMWLVLQPTHQPKVVFASIGMLLSWQISSCRLNRRITDSIDSRPPLKLAKQSPSMLKLSPNQNPPVKHAAQFFSQKHPSQKVENLKYIRAI